MKLKDLTGKRFGRLVVVKKKGTNKRRCREWECLCQCGKTTVVESYPLTSGHTKSCGCLSRETAKKKMTTHNMWGTKTYNTWHQMIQRCKNKNDSQYRDYGGRGVDVCDRWLKFENFYQDMGKKPSRLFSIERIDNERGYTPENCKWATAAEQSRNKRIQKRNKSGVPGVWFNKNKNKYQATIGVNYQTHFIGYFTELTEAVAARKSAEKEYWRDQHEV